MDCICPVQMYPSAEASLAGGSGRLAGWGAWMIGTAVEKGIPRRSGVGFTSGIRPEGRGDPSPQPRGCRASGSKEWVDLPRRDG